MKIIYVFLPLFAATFSGQAQIKDDKTIQIDQVINSWHEAAAAANFETYFSILSNDAVFIGTDATENWNKEEFKEYAKPHFDKGKAWNFKPLDRHIYFSTDKKTAWFDELLDTQMKICRGSGVLVKVKNEWKIAHYVLSMTIQNELSNEVVKLKMTSDDLILDQLTP
jgi:hypothetical protein